MAFIEAKDYRFFYPEQTEPALNIGNLQIEKGSFCLLAGASGSGKTSLLRQLSKETMLQGKTEGVLSCQAGKCAYVWQNPESQIVTDRVEYEIVFGLENIGMPREQMQRRLAEVVTFFGLEDLADCDTMNLSGGELQTVNVAAAIAMNPDLLLLDEPTSQLDPVAARRLYELLHQINEELGVTVLLAEQRLEQAVSFSDQMIFMKCGQVAVQGSPSEVYSRLCETPDIFYFPSYMRFFHGLSESKRCPSSMKEARQWFETNFKEKKVETERIGNRQKTEKENKQDYILCKNLSFRYEKHMPDVLRECSCKIKRGSITCLAGGNGSGKTTLLRILTGQYHPYLGRMKNMPEDFSMLPQQPSYLFLQDTVEEECGVAGDMTRKLAERFGLMPLMNRNPADLSGGEQQRLGLSLVFGKKADIYLLDEPSKGLDFASKRVLGEILREKREEGGTVLIVSHDMEFAADYADVMALMFQGRIELITDTRQFFEENQFYTTSINRMARGVSEHIITQEDIKRYAEKKCN